MEISKSTQKILAKQGLKFMLNTKVTNAVNNGSSVSVTVEDKKGEKVVCCYDIYDQSTNAPLEISCVIETETQ